MKAPGLALTQIDRDSEIYHNLQIIHRKIAKKDSSTWGAKAAAEAAIRLNWIDLPEQSEALLPEIAQLRRRFSSINQIVLCGMGGSSLGPEVIAKSYHSDLDKEIFFLDSTDPNYVQHALSKDLSQTLVIVSSKSGSTIETAAARALFETAFAAANLPLNEHMLVITDPGSPLDSQARDIGIHVVNADPHVGGRFSVLSAFGLVPTGIAGAPVTDILLDARKAMDELIVHEEKILDIAYLILTKSEQYLSFTDAESKLPGLSDWIEQLIAESTGKDGVGRLPVVVEKNHAKREMSSISISFAGTSSDITLPLPLGGQFIFWEWLTAAIGAALKIDPFNQPNVTEAKEQTAELLEEWGSTLPIFEANCVAGEIEIFGDGQTLLDALATFIEGVKDDGYIAIMAYLDRQSDVKLFELRAILEEKSGKPTTFGWGPRFLHSTGQFHKGGQKNGSFLQITGVCEGDFAIEGKPYSLQTLLFAQALGDARALEKRKYPLLRLHLNNRSAAIDQILKAARSL
jgi:glucose-6-phosphate isomerase